MNSWNRSLARWFKGESEPRPSRRRRSPLGIEELEGRNLLSVSPIAYKTGGYYDSVDVNGTFYFSTTAGELWKTDGTPGGTALVKDMDPLASSGPGPSGMTNVSGTLFFQYKDPANGHAAIWKSDGTDAGTVVVKDVDEYSAWRYSIKSFGDLAAVNGFLYFTDVDSTGTHVALWKTDGTTAGTVMVKDLSALLGPASIYEMTNVNGTLFFAVVGNFSNLDSLWKSDGTAAGTIPIESDLFGIGGLTNISGKLAFTSDAVVPSINEYGNTYMKWVGEDLWITDGMDYGTVLLKQFGRSALGMPTDVNSSLYITEETDQDTKLWKSDGTAAGTFLVKDFPGVFQIENLTDINSTLYFTARDFKIALWKSDGTEAGTVLIKVLGEGNPDVSPLINVNGKLYLSLYDEAIAFERPSIGVLWESDGTEAGTNVIPETSTNHNFSWIFQLTSVNGNLFFVDLVNTGPTNIQGLIVGKVDNGNGPPSNPVDLSTLDGKVINDPPPEPGLVWPIYVPPTAPIPDAFSRLLIPLPQAPETLPPKSDVTKPDVSNIQADVSNIQVSLAINGSPGPVTNQSIGSSQLSESVQAHAQSSIPLTISLGFSNTSAKTSNHFLISSPRGGFSVAEDEPTIADLDSFFGLEAKDPETVVVLGD